jgi:hypothetical protein
MTDAEIIAHFRAHQAMILVAMHVVGLPQLGAFKVQVGILRESAISTGNGPELAAYEDMIAAIDVLTGWGA